jgi:glyoxylase-like metal-dependent hydrolase (beta-lactamase superfamily II)
LIVPIYESRKFLAGLGIESEILHTPGHSDDSVSLVLGHDEAFTGDLTPESMIGTEDADVVARSWQQLRERGVTTIYGGHGPVRSLTTKPG